MNPNVERQRWPDEMDRRGFLSPIDEYDYFDAQQLAELMREPLRNINKCFSKGQIATLCFQLLAQNTALKLKLENIKQQSQESNTK